MLPQSFSRIIPTSSEQYHPTPPGKFSVSETLKKKSVQFQSPTENFKTQPKKLMIDCNLVSEASNKIERACELFRWHQLLNQGFELYAEINGKLVAINHDNLAGLDKKFKKSSADLPALAGELTTKTGEHLSPDEYHIVTQASYQKLLSLNSGKAQCVYFSDIGNGDIDRCKKLVESHNIQKIIFTRLTLTEETLKLLRMKLNDTLPDIFQIEEPLFTGASYQFLSSLEDLEENIQNAVLSGLEILDAGCSNITGSALSSILQKSPHLKNLDAGGCKTLSKTWQVLPEGLKFLKLEELNVFDSDITGSALSSILQKSPNLKNLYVRGCTSLSKDWQALSEGLKFLQLEELNVFDSDITGSALLDLLKKSPNLKTLDISSCRNIVFTDELVASLDKIPSVSGYNKSSKITAQSTQSPVARRSSFPPFFAVDHASSIGEISPTTSSSGGSPPSHTIDSAAKVDANTQYNANEKFNVTRYFFAPTASSGNKRDEDPLVRHYRLTCFNTLVVNEKVCDRADAFQLSNQGDARLISPHPEVNLVNQDLFSKVNTLSADSSNEKKQFFYGKITLTLNRRDWHALPSLSASEVLTHLNVAGISSNDLDIQYSARDNLYCVRLKENSTKETAKVTLDFIVEKTRHPLAIPHHINTLLNEINGYSKERVKSEAELTLKTGGEYLQEMIEKKVGACRHRAIVFMHLLHEMEKNYSDDQKTPCRFVGNDCHAFVECLIEENEKGPKQWVSYDLGGYAATLEIDDALRPKTPTPAPTPRAAQSLFSTTASSSKSETAPPPLFTPAEIRRIVENSMPTQLAPPPLLGKYFENSAVAAESRDKAIKIYCQEVCGLDIKKHLLTLPDEKSTEAFGIHLQLFCESVDRPYFYINHPDELICNAETLEVVEGDKGKSVGPPSGALFAFLQKCEKAADTGVSPIMIVNFNHFTPAERVKYNTLLDNPPSVDGTALPESIRIIGLFDPNAPSNYADSSFYSRFSDQQAVPYGADALAVARPFEALSAAATSHASVEINLYSSSDWKEMLLGTWYLNGQDIRPIEGALVAALAQGKTDITFLNPPHDPDFELFLHQLEFLKDKKEEKDRVLLVHGKAIPIPNNLSCVVENGYQLENLPMVIKTDAPPKEAHVLNDTLFWNAFFEDQFDLASRGLKRAPGWLNSGQSPLSVYVNDTLSLDRWMQLIDYCRLHHPDLVLNLHCAPGVQLPAEMVNSLQLSVMTLATALPAKDHTAFIHTHDRYQAVAECSGDSKPMIIDISEMSAQDLLKKLSGEYLSNEKRFIFSETETVLSKALADGKTVILTGTCSKETQDILSGYLFQRSQADQASGKLIFVSEERNPFEGILPTIERLYPEQRQVASATTPTAKTDHPGSPNTTHQSRLAMITGKLETQPIVILEGLTGVGKTSFMEKYWSDDNRKLFKEHELLAWAHDTSSGLNTLFIDEANLSEKEWTMFEGLFFEPRSIVIDGEYIPLTKQHNVVFAGNPRSYSADRHLPSLFERHPDCFVHFEPLSTDYIAKEILAPLFDLFDLKNKSLMEAITKPILDCYEFLVRCSTEHVLITPREMSMAALLAIACVATEPSDQTPKEPNENTRARDYAANYIYQLTQGFVPPHKKAAFEEKFKPAWQPFTPEEMEDLSLTQALVRADQPDFFITASNAPAAMMLSDLLALRQWRINTPGKTPLSAGLGGILLEGSPGVGKSQLAIELLLKHEIKEAPKDQKTGLYTLNQSDTTTQHFYRIPANFSPTEKEKILLHAFHTGSPVIWDEINSSASLEQLLNTLLMGKDPQGNPPKQPGFLLIGTQNPASMGGRMRTSSALLHRMHHCIIPEYTQSEMIQIAMQLHLPKSYAKTLATQYLAKKDKGHLAFRNFIETVQNVKKGCADILQEIEKSEQELKIKKSNYSATLTNAHASNNDLVKIAKETTNPDILRVIMQHHVATSDIGADLVRKTVYDNSVCTSELLSLIAKETHNPKVLQEILLHPNCTGAIKKMAEEWADLRGGLRKC